MRLFWILSFAIAWAITLPPALAQLGIIDSSPIPSGIGLLIGFAPIVAAAIAAVRKGQGRAYWRSLAALPRPAWTALLAILFPAGLLGLAYVASSAMGKPIGISANTSVMVMGLAWLILAFGEEAGWRGFALPRLVERHGFWLGSFILGLLWCLWHYPRLLGSPYLGSLSEALPLIALFSLQIVIANFIFCWLYFRSGRSVIAPTLFHACFNLIATMHFLAATDPVITAAMAAAVAAIAWIDPRPANRAGRAS